MNKVLSYYKKYMLTIFLLGVILFAMVRFELLLPKYTSNIVNIGIQQGGFTDTVPRIVDEKNYAMILSLASQKDKKVIAGSYELWDSSSKNKKYLDIKESNRYIDIIPEGKYSGNYYVLKESTDIGEIENNMSNALLSYGKYLAGRENNNIDTSSLNSVSTDLPNSMKKQIGIKIVENIYKGMGVRVDGLQKSYLWKTGILMVIMSLLSGGLSISVSFISSRLSALIAKELRKDVFKKVMSFSNKEINKFSIASLITRSTNDIQQIQQSSVILLRFLFYGPLMAVGALLNVFTLDVSMVWIIALSVLVTITSIALIMSKALPKFKIVQSVVDKMNLVTREFISGIEVNRVFRTEKYEENRFDEVNKELTRINLFTTRMMSLMQPIMMLIMNFATLMVVWFGAKQISNGVIQVGDMMAFLEYTMQIIMAFLFISMVSVILPRAMISANRISEVLNTESSILDTGKVNDIGKVKSLRFNNVSFRYGEKSEEVIKNISFEAQKGETVGIIGSTGAGKSTIVNLIPRFIEATRGEISINGIDTKDISLKKLREVISVVPQKSVIFSGTIATNIEYAQSVKNYKRMKLASDIAQCDEFVKLKEDGYETKVSQNGGNLSGGQKQRVSIARSLTRDAEILVFDDSFSALDANTDKTLRRELKKNLRDEIVIIVSQRINTIIDADKIIVIDNGKVVGLGTHGELVNNCNIYYEIAKSQLSEEVLKNEK